MTTTTLNSHPAHEQIRPVLLQVLSDYAHEKGLETWAGSRSTHARKPGKALRTTMPQPDITWLKGRKPLWKFYVLPRRSTLKRLHADVDVVGNPVVCADSSDNLGVINPLQLLLFLFSNSTSVAKDKLRSLMKNISALRAPTPNFHFKGIVRKNHQFIKDHFSLCITAEFVERPMPGQFLQLLCDPAPHAASPKYKCHSYTDRRLPKIGGMELVGKRPFLRRPFSIASYGPGSNEHLGDSRLFGPNWYRLINWLESELEIIYRRIPGGAGTGALARYGVGDEIDVVGPLGKGFTIDPPPEIALLIGGGMGSPPLLFLAEELVRSGIKTKIFLGAVTRSRFPFQLRKPNNRIASFERLGLHPIVCTDDGSIGRRGLVTDALLKYIEKEGVSTQSAKLFACGPRSMLAALDGIANRFELPCEVLLEERMACGFGACISCVCAVKEPGQKARFTRICTEGPAFDVRTVMWHA